MILGVIPALTKYPSLTTKGGTAINRFYLDRPRLSVDSDLCYLPIRERQESFQDMHQILSETNVCLRSWVSDGWQFTVTLFVQVWIIARSNLFFKDTENTLSGRDIVSFEPKDTTQ